MTAATKTKARTDAPTAGEAHELWGMIEEYATVYSAHVCTFDGAPPRTPEDSAIDHHNYGIAYSLLRDVFMRVVGYDPREWEAS